MILRPFVQDTRSMFLLSSPDSMSLAYGIFKNLVYGIFNPFFFNSCLLEFTFFVAAAFLHYFSLKYI